MAQIVNLILTKLVDDLTAALITNIPDGDATKADVVKRGLLQQDKVSRNIEIGVTGGDHDDPNYTDGIIDLQRMPQVGFYAPAREVGGGELWWRKGVARVDCFFVRERLTEDESFEAAYKILGRIEKAIALSNMSGLTDEFGEKAIKVFCYGNTFFQSGGPPKSFIFRGKILWQCLTERP
jgi:hypothetical protein